jgi:hypothetical protein
MKTVEAFYRPFPTVFIPTCILVDLVRLDSAHSSLETGSKANKDHASSQGQTYVEPPAQFSSFNSYFYLVYCIYEV